MRAWDAETTAAIEERGPVVLWGLCYACTRKIAQVEDTSHGLLYLAERIPTVDPAKIRKSQQRRHPERQVPWIASGITERSIVLLGVDGASPPPSTAEAHCPKHGRQRPDVGELLAKASQAKATRRQINVRCSKVVHE